MQVLKKIQDVRDYLVAVNEPIGFVPTMGALHQGHISLVRRALQDSPEVLCSIFVNPTQFNNASDLATYPRSPEADLDMLQQAGCKAVFMPEPAEMYVQPPRLQFDFGALERVMEGKYRPGHFNGVALVVAKLFNIIQPRKAYFGQKDLQQCIVVEQLVKDLSFPVEVVRCPTLREASGLAMSSRNRRLSAKGLTVAPQLYQAMQQVGAKIKTHGEVAKALAEVRQWMQLFPQFELEYLEVAHPETLEALDYIAEGNIFAVCVAAYLEGVRLIDNLLDCR